jgi:hypothetical protein
MFLVLKQLMARFREDVPILPHEVCDEKTLKHKAYDFQDVGHPYSLVDVRMVQIFRLSKLWIIICLLLLTDEIVIYRRHDLFVLHIIIQISNPESLYHPEEFKP